MNHINKFKSSTYVKAPYSMLVQFENNTLLSD